MFPKDKKKRLQNPVAPFSCEKVYIIEYLYTYLLLHKYMRGSRYPMYKNEFLIFFTWEGPNEVEKFVFKHL